MSGPTLLDLRETKWIPITKEISVDFSQRACLPYRGPPRIVTQIGSPSQEGEVYLVKMDKHIMAMKVLPHVDPKSRDRIANELKIAQLASDAVVNGLVTHFPLVYKTAYCPETHFKDLSPFKERSELYGLRSVFRGWIEKVSHVSARLFFERSRLMNNKHDIEVLASTFLSVGSIQSGQGHSSCDLLFSELAYSDLKQFIEVSELTVSHWLTILHQLVDSITELGKLGIIHNDLHLGNVLVLVDQKRNIKLLLHDFGRSELNSEKRLHWRNLADMRKALDHILEIGNTRKIIPKRVMEIVEDMTRRLTEFIQKYEDR